MKRRGIICAVSLIAMLAAAPLWADEDAAVEVPEDVGALLLEALEKSLDVKPREGIAEQGEPAGAEKDSSEHDGPPWLADLADGRRKAQLEKRPLLVRLTATWCLPCKMLERELADPAVVEQLTRYVLVEVDVDRSPEIARNLAVQGIPALRLLSPAGKSVTGIDGFRPARELAAWLKENHEAAAAESPDVLIAETAPSKAELGSLLQYLSARDPVMREAAVRRLLAHPEVTREATAAAFVEGNLAVRLAALEVLRAWNAPLEEVDPWRPETISDERLARLEAWAAEGKPETAGPPEELEGERLAEARDEIAALMAAEEPDVPARIARISRHGTALLNEVVRQLADASADRDQQRLTLLRYHLVASRRLALQWPEGLNALASGELEVRRQAADQLTSIADAAEQKLLLELFADPDPVVREIVLRGLRDLGGPATAAALARLLKDPEPNVRAAVLKQLTESPQRAMDAHVVEYVAQESNQDLLVHAVRVLKQSSGEKSTAALVSLASHPSWQVRAAVAEGLGEIAQSSDRYGMFGARVSAAKSEKVVDALVTLLDDEDGFVVSRALKSVAKTGTVPAKRLAEIIERHPQLAKDAIEVMVSGGSSVAVDHLERLARHENPQARAAALAGLRGFAVKGGRNGVSTDKFPELLLAGLEDGESTVRIAAARELLAFYESKRPDHNEVETLFGDPATTINVETSAAGLIGEAIGSVGESILGLFGKRSKKGSEEPPDETDPTPVVQEVDEAADASDQAGEVPPDAGEVDLEAELFPAEGPTATPAFVSDSTTEQWLNEFRAGKERPEWASETAPHLQKMVDTGSAEERMWGALALLPLGTYDEPALAVLLETVERHPDLAPQTHQALPWLEWDERGMLFDRLLEKTSQPAHLHSLTQKLVEIRNPLAVARLWRLLGSEQVTPESAGMIVQSLRESYFGDHWYDSSETPAAQRQAAKADSLRYVEEGSAWQKTTGLVLLAGVDKDEAAKQAETLYRNSATEDVHRISAFKVLLASSGTDPANQVAVKALGEKDPGMRTTALKFLAHGESALQQLHGSIFLQLSHSMSYGSSGRRSIIIPQAPAGIDRDVLRSLLENEDEETAAYAAYFLTLLDEPHLPRLLAYWQKAGQDEKLFNDSWARLVYRAVAYADNAEQIPVLQSIYKKLQENHHDVVEFYWTIRIMTGPDALALRKQIRSEVGMDNLR